LPNYKIEIKNLNSFRFVEKAINYEIKRQIEQIKASKKLVQETRGWDEVKQITYSQRTKEEAQDYRYFPEPDLPPIRWTEKQINKIKANLPELPAQKLKRLMLNFNLSKEQAQILITDSQKTDYFEKAVKFGQKRKLSVKNIANMIINKRVNIQKISPEKLVEILIKKQAQPTLSQPKLKQLVIKVIKENSKPVEEFKKGKLTVIEFLIGQVMKQTKGQANPDQIRQLMKKHLSYD